MSVRLEGLEYMISDGPERVSIHDQFSGLDKIGRYFAHGLVFSILMTVSTFVLAFLLVMFVILASFLGFVIWFGVVFLVWGLINGKMCSWLWHFEVRQHWTSLLGHGFVLFIVLLIVGLPATFLGAFLPATGTVAIALNIVRLIVYAFIDGIVGKDIGNMFAETHIPSIRRQVSRTPTEPLTNCPYCGAVFPYREIDLTREGTASCRQCGATIQDPRFRPGGPRRPASGYHSGENKAGPSPQW